MLTHNQSGNWFDPQYPDQGFEFHVFENGTLFGLFFAGSVPIYSTVPIWLLCGGEPTKNEGNRVTYTLFQTNTVFGDSRTSDRTALGEVCFVISSENPKAIAAEITIDGRGLAQFSPPYPVHKVTYNLIPGLLNYP